MAGGRPSSSPSAGSDSSARLSFLADYSLTDRRLRQTPPLTQRVAAIVDRPLGAPLKPRGDAGALQAEPLVPETLIEGVAHLAPRLAPDYDPAFLRWLLPSVASIGARGTLIAVGLRERATLAGWYLYFLRPGGISDVLQVAGVEGRVGHVLDHLFADACGRGAAMLRGRIESRLLEPLRAAGVSSATTAARSCRPARPRSPRRSQIRHRS